MQSIDGLSVTFTDLFKNRKKGILMTDNPSIVAMFENIDVYGRNPPSAVEGGQFGGWGVKAPQLFT